MDYKRSRWILLVALLVLLLPLIYFYYPFLVQGKSYYLHDITLQYEPRSRFIADSFRQWHVPLWNPYSNCGTSEVALTTPGIFYFPNLIFVCTSFSQALASYLLLHQLVAASGAFLLVMVLGWGIFPALVCAASLALNGYMFSTEIVYPTCATTSWISWCAVASLLWRRSPGIGTLLLSVGAVFMLITAGRPEIFVPVLSGVVSYGAVRIGLDRERTYRDKIACFALYLLPVFLACMLAMPAVIPALEWLRLSPRAKGLSLAEVSAWSANWYDYLSMLCFQPFGDCYARTSPFIEIALSGKYVPVVQSCYVGPVVFGLAIWGAADRTFRHRFWLAAVLIGILLVTAGKQTPLLPALVSLPGFAIVRYPIKLMILPIFLLSIFAARGAFVLASKQLGTRTLFLTLALFTLQLALGMLLQLAPIETVFQPIAGSSLPHEFFSAIGLAVATAALLGIALCAVTWAVRHGHSRSPVQFAFITVCLVGCLLENALLICRHATDSNFFEQPSFVAQALLKASHGKIQSPLAYRFANLDLAVPVLTVRHPEQDPTLSACSYRRQTLSPTVEMDYHIPSTLGYESLETWQMFRVFRPIFNRSTLAVGPDSKVNLGNNDALTRFLQMTSTIYVYTQLFKMNSAGAEVAVPVLQGAFQPILVDAQMNTRLYALKPTLPRAYICRNLRFVQGEDALAGQLIGRGAVRFDPLTTCLLEGKDEQTVRDAGIKLRTPGGINSEANQSQAPDMRTDSSASMKDSVLSSVSEIREFNQTFPEHLDLSARLISPGLLVVTDLFYPGWHVKVDSQPGKIVRVNGMLKGVALAAGDHKVEFDFFPESLVSGLLCALTGLALMAIAIIGIKRWGRSAENAHL